VQIGDEVMTYVGRFPEGLSAASVGAANTSSGVLLNVQRGVNGTASSAHSQGTSVVLVSACVGDCKNDRLGVSVDEILTMVNIALGSAPLLYCEAADANHDGRVTVDEILSAVNAALNGCPTL